MRTFYGFNSNRSTLYGDSLLITTESPGDPGTLLINLTMKKPSAFKWVNPGLVIGNHLIDYYSFIITKQRIKYLKYKLNMINKTYLRHIRISHYSKNISSCHVLNSHPSSNKISPYLKLKLPFLSFVIFYPPPHSPKNL